jgi:membrane protease YdiL (CAAX protease family)
MIHTLTPDVRAYALTAIGLLALSCLTLAAHLHTRWPWVRRLPLLGVHVLIMTILVVAAVLVLGAATPILPLPGHPAGWWGAAAGLVVGPPLGLLIIRVDRAVTTKWRDRRGPRAAVLRGPQRTTEARPAGFVTAGSSLNDRRRTGLVRARNDYAPTEADLRVRLGLLIAVAIGEEVTYRGVLIALADLFPHWTLTVAAILLACVVFACAHVFFGWVQVLAKLPLSVLAAVATVVTGAVVAAVVAHVVFNVWVWRYRRAMPVAVPVPERKAVLA